MIILDCFNMLFPSDYSYLGSTITQKEIFFRQGFYCEIFLFVLKFLPFTMSQIKNQTLPERLWPQNPSTCWVGTRLEQTFGTVNGWNRLKLTLTTTRRRQTRIRFETLIQTRLFIYFFLKNRVFRITSWSLRKQAIVH